jgi:hypothetical protein
MPHASADPVTAAGMPSPESLAFYEMQRPLFDPLLRWCRLVNTVFDVLFYDVGVLTTALLAKGTVIDTGAATNLGSRWHPLAVLDVSAQSNPSGSIIVVDANLAPYIRKPFLDMKEFLIMRTAWRGTGSAPSRSPGSGVPRTGR